MEGNNKYRVVEFRDAGNYENLYGTIMLNYKHSTKDFQKVIDEIKEDFDDNEIYDWMVEDVLADERLEQFDYFYLNLREE